MKRRFNTVVKLSPRSGPGDIYASSSGDRATHPRLVDLKTSKEFHFTRGLLQLVYGRVSFDHATSATQHIRKKLRIRRHHIDTGSFLYFKIPLSGKEERSLNYLQHNTVVPTIKAAPNVVLGSVRSMVSHVVLIMTCHLPPGEKSHMKKLRSREASAASSISFKTYW